MPRRVFLHIGTPKSGTSYLQDRLALNGPALEAQGLTYPETRSGDHFEAALDLIGERWAGAEKEAAGQWDSLVAAAQRSRHDVLISHEILAAAKPDRLRRALAAFPDDEVHVVVTARDLGRQIPAEWQERVKHRGRRPFARFLDSVVKNHGKAEQTMWFWRVQDLPDVLARWGADLPPERVHLVTVPASGGSPTALWDRFTGVLGLDPAASYAESETTNASLGGAEVTLLRRLNSQLADLKVPRGTYVEWVRELVVKDVLAGRRDSPRAAVPPGRRAWVDDLTEQWIGQIRGSGIDVVGDVEDLRSAWPDDGTSWPDPDEADPALVADAAIAALAHVLANVAQDDPRRPGPLARFAWRFRS